MFCDNDGERVVAACGALPPFDVDVIGASFAVFAPGLGPDAVMRVRLAAMDLWLAPVALGYYVAVVAEPGRSARVRAALPTTLAALRDGM